MARVAVGDDGAVCAQVPVVEILEIGVWDADALANDRCLGVVEVRARVGTLACVRSDRGSMLACMLYCAALACMSEAPLHVSEPLGLGDVYMSDV